MCFFVGFQWARLMPMESKAHWWTVTQVDVSMVSFCSGKHVILAYYVSMVCMVTMVTVMVSLAEKMDQRNIDS